MFTSSPLTSMGTSRSAQRQGLGGEDGLSARHADLVRLGADRNRGATSN